MNEWMAHLERYGLLELHQEAQAVGYRLRAANSFTFDLEYEGGLDRYYERGYAVKRFSDTPAGREEARQFLAAVKADLL